MPSSEVLHALPIPGLIVARDYRVLHQNQAARALFDADLVSKHVARALRQPSVLDAIEIGLTQGSKRSVRYTVPDAGRDQSYDVYIAPLRSGNTVLVSFLDVSSYEEAGQMRSDFVANVSHELRTPLTALSGFIETLRGPARDDPEARHRFLDIMDAEAGRMNRLVTDLLSLSRVEDMARMRPTDMVEVDQLIEMAISALAPAADERSVRFKTQFIASRPTMVMGDHDQLTQVFTNLFENSIKYGREGGTVFITICAPQQVPAFKGPGLKIIVRDEGEGIAPKHLGRLTERFYRVDNHRSRALGGTGLGLAIVKHIVNRHRGRLRIESTPGKGSSFFVTLPLPAEV